MIYDVWKWIKNKNDAEYLFGNAGNFVLNDKDIERLKNGEILNFTVAAEYGCTLEYKSDN